jgi:two-component system, NarL family, response regulator DesR
LIRTLICEDAGLLRAGLVSLLSQPTDIEVVVQLHNSQLIVPVAIATQPNVAVIDIDMPGSLAALGRLNDAVPDCRILTLSGPPERDERDDRGPGQGSETEQAQGSILKTASPDFIVRAVRRVARGERVIDPGLAGGMSSATGSPLTRREADVLREAAKGLSAAEIAERLVLSPGTVRNYISRAIAKTGTRNRTDAIRHADEKGWIPPPEPPAG